MCEMASSLELNFGIFWDIFFEIELVFVILYPELLYRRTFDIT